MRFLSAKTFILTVCFIFVTFAMVYYAMKERFIATRQNHPKYQSINEFLNNFIFNLKPKETLPNHQEIEINSKIFEGIPGPRGSVLPPEWQNKMLEILGKKIQASHQAKEEKRIKETVEKKPYTLSVSVTSPEKNIRIEGERKPYECEKNFTVRQVVRAKETFDESVIKRHPNLPWFLLTSNNFSSSIPEIGNIRWNGIIYQESWRRSPKYLLYSAHFDPRNESELAVWIISMYDGDTMPKKSEFFCQMWFSKDENPVMTPVVDVFCLLSKDLDKDVIKPYGIKCLVPIQQNSSFPIAVSLVKHKCQTPSNILKISGSPLRRQSISRLDKLRKELKIGICGKALFYYNEDFSVRLIEWIEVMRQLGVSKIFLYKMPCHKNLEKVLDYYEKTGFVNLTTFYYPPPYVQDGTFVRIWTETQIEEAWAAQSLYISDCLLKNKGDFDYLGVFDSDEVPILRKHNTIQDFIKFVIRENVDIGVGGYSLLWKVMYEEVNPGPTAANILVRYHIMRHNRRTLLKGKESEFEKNGKTFYDTDYVLFANCHKPLRFSASSPSKIRHIEVNRSVAYTAHYRDHPCPSSYCAPQFIEEDNTLLKFKDKVIPRVNEVCDLLGIY